MSYSEIASEVKKRGDWSDDTICQNLMSHVKNLIPAKYNWVNAEKFLFLRGDGRYEIYDPKVHPEIVEYTACFEVNHGTDNINLCSTFSAIMGDKP